MATVIVKGRNPIIAAAWAGLEAQRRAEAKKPAPESNEPAARKKRAQAAMESVAKPVLAPAKKERPSVSQTKAAPAHTKQAQAAMKTVVMNRRGARP